MKSSLSKSKFIRGLLCPRSLWLLVHKPELLSDSNTTALARMEEGKEVGRLAQDLYPGGKEVVYTPGALQEQAKQTAQWIEQGVATIYEATFIHEDVAVMVDILHRGPEGWEIFEVKASTQIKDIYIEDVAIQYYVVRGAGLPVSRSSLVHLNNQYVRHGDLNLSQLFDIGDLTDSVSSRQASIPDEIPRLKEMLKRGEPGIDIGPQCDNYEYCGFEGHCWAHVPAYTIFNLARIRKEKKWDLYGKGIRRIEDIPDDYTLTENQTFQVEAAKTGKDIIDREAIQAFLDTLSYPLYFLDFETIQYAIPPFDGVKPYQKIPFQFSLHSLDHERANLSHAEFLGTPGVDPRREIAQRLAQSIPGDACVLAYNMGFEKGVLKDLAEQFPDLGKKLMRIYENMRDLMTPFQKKYYYTKEMQGSYSIKSVLPALVPELSYEGMAISGGDEASSVYKALRHVTDEKEVVRIRQDLLHYCALDTLGMVRLLEKLRAL